MTIARRLTNAELLHAEYLLTRAILHLKHRSRHGRTSKVASETRFVWGWADKGDLQAATLLDALARGSAQQRLTRGHREGYQKAKVSA